MVLQGIKNKSLLGPNPSIAEVATQKWQKTMANSANPVNGNNVIKRNVIEAMTETLRSKSDLKKSTTMNENNNALSQSKIISQNSVRQPNKAAFVPNQINKIYPINSNALSNIEALIQISASDGIKSSFSPDRSKLPFILKKPDELSYIKDESYPKFPYIPASTFPTYENKINSASSKSELLKKNSFDEDKNY